MSQEDTIKRLELEIQLVKLKKQLKKLEFEEDNKEMLALFQEFKDTEYNLKTLQNERRRLYGPSGKKQREKMALNKKIRPLQKRIEVIKTLIPEYFV